MERYCIFGEFNTFLDWDLILTAKDLTPPEPKTYYVEIDGMDGSLDLSESLSGGVVYKDRIFKASFWTDHGKRSDRVDLLQEIRSAIHGKKIHIIEPDDPDHYLVGRLKITGESNNLAYAEIQVEATCEPYRYDNESTVRNCKVTSGADPVDIVIHNRGSKVLTPNVTVTGSVELSFKDNNVSLEAGSYKISDLKLYQGVNVVQVSGSGSVTFEYTEAYI